MTHLMDTQSASCLVSPVITNELMNKAAVTAVIEVMHGLSNIDLCSPRLT